MFDWIHVDNSKFHLSPAGHPPVSIPPCALVIDNALLIRIPHLGMLIRISTFFASHPEHQQQPPPPLKKYVPFPIHGTLLSCKPTKSPPYYNYFISWNSTSPKHT